MVSRQRFIDYLDAATCMEIAETESNVVFNAFEELQYEFGDILKEEGISMYKRDPESESSVIYVTRGNTVTIYESNVKNIIKLNKLCEYYQAIMEIRDLVDDDEILAKILKNKHDTCYEDFANNHIKYYLPYINTIYALETAGSIDDLKFIIIEHICGKLESIFGWHFSMNCTDNDVMFIDNNLNIHRFECSFKNLSEIGKYIKNEKENYQNIELIMKK